MDELTLLYVVTLLVVTATCGCCSWIAYAIGHNNGYEAGVKAMMREPKPTGQRPPKAPPRWNERADYND